MTKKRTIASSDDTSTKKGPSEPRAPKNYWTNEEDLKLRQLATTEETDFSWSKVSMHFINRSAKQCRERWTEYLNPSLDHSDFSPEEDRIINSTQKEIGNAWRLIAEKLSPKVRSPSQVKTRWHYLNRQVAECKRRCRKSKFSLAGMNSNEINFILDVDTQYLLKNTDNSNATTAIDSSTKTSLDSLWYMTKSSSATVAIENSLTEIDTCVKILSKAVFSNVVNLYPAKGFLESFEAINCCPLTEKKVEFDSELTNVPLMESVSFPSIDPSDKFPVPDIFSKNDELDFGCGLMLPFQD